MNMYLQLFLAYAKVGAVTFGGGYAMLPVLKRELVDRRNWVSEDDLVDCYAIGQCTPGVIAVNAATLIGYQKKGILGSICATVGVVFVPVLIIISIATLIEQFADNKYVQHALAGMSVAICALITLTVIGLIKKTCKDVPAVIIALCVFILCMLVDIPTVFVVIAAAIAGVIIKNVKVAKAKKGGKS
ncbi:MAG: chromate transporter [Clostridia bacterium]|nr:chromate transporter [Clostridia bacterium]MBQ7048387.1 chromate transporter [Clostridia bacterium]